jgi:hypothetical protein
VINIKPKTTKHRNILYVVPYITRLDTRRSVLIDPVDERTTAARFFWPFVKPDEEYPPYSVSVTPNLVAEMDTRFPVVPTALVLYEDDPASRQPLEQIVGREISDLIYRAKEIGGAVVPFTLKDEGRLAIARLQFEYPQTPEHIRAADALILGR